MSDATFARDVLGVAGKPVLVDCWAPWCGPCRMLEPTIKQLAAESGGRYVIAKLNTAVNEALDSQDVRERFRALNLNPGGGSPEEMRRFVKNETARWSEVIKKAGVTPQ